MASLRQPKAFRAGGGHVQTPAVAIQRGFSLRTMQRRLRHLQYLSGVQSWLQLGWYAAKHDWA